MHVTPVLLALIAAAQSVVATVAMAYVRIRTHTGDDAELVEAV